jgi:hypothetical protein
VKGLRTWRVPPLAFIQARARLTLALLEDLSRLLIVHGYPPLRGRALTELTLSLQRIDEWSD